MHSNCSFLLFLTDLYSHPSSLHPVWPSWHSSTMSTVTRFVSSEVSSTASSLCTMFWDLTFFLLSALRLSSQQSKLSDAGSRLAQQRLKRPVSPYFSIYKPQITWVVSITTRITGIALSGGLYLFATAYFFSPVTGWDIGSASLVNGVGSLSPSTAFALKCGVALPFTFHCFNGVRHLVWDTGRGLANLQVNRTGWAVVGASSIAAALLALWKPSDDD